MSTGIDSERECYRCLPPLKCQEIKHCLHLTIVVPPQNNASAPPTAAKTFPEPWPSLLGGITHTGKLKLSFPFASSGLMGNIGVGEESV